MKNRNRDTSPLRSGYTLVELMVVIGILFPVLAACATGLVYAVRRSASITSQVNFSTQARMASNRIGHYIENSRLVFLNSDDGSLLLQSASGTVARIAFEDADEDIATVADNTLVYYPNSDSAAGARVLCTHVSPLPDADIFRLISQGSASSVLLAIHIGDSDAPDARDITGPGRQGIELRYSASPRNIQRTY